MPDPGPRKRTRSKRPRDSKGRFISLERVAEETSELTTNTTITLPSNALPQAVESGPAEPVGEPNPDDRESTAVPSCSHLSELGPDSRTWTAVPSHSHSPFLRPSSFQYSSPPSVGITPTTRRVRFETRRSPCPSPLSHFSSRLRSKKELVINRPRKRLFAKTRRLEARSLSTPATVLVPGSFPPSPVAPDRPAPEPIVPPTALQFSDSPSPFHSASSFRTYREPEPPISSSSPIPSPSNSRDVSPAPTVPVPLTAFTERQRLPSPSPLHLTQPVHQKSMPPLESRSGSLRWGPSPYRAEDQEDAGPSDHQERPTAPPQDKGKQPAHPGQPQSEFQSVASRPRLPYSRSQYLQDAVLIRLAVMETNAGQFSELLPLLSKELSEASLVVVRAMPTKTRYALEDQAKRDLRSSCSPLFKASRMTAIFERFLLGPNQDDDDENEPSESSPQPDYRQEDHRDRQSSHRPPHASLSPPEPSEYDKYQSRPSYPPSRDFKVDLLAFESTDQPVSAYIDKVEWLSSTFGQAAVLRNIVPGLLSKPRSDGCRWFTSLDRGTKSRLQYDIGLWKTLLLQRFQQDRGQIMLQADKLRHFFDKEDELSIHEYVDKKILLYHEAGSVDEDLTAHRLAYDSDPILAALVDLTHKPLTIDDVRQQLMAKHFVARRQWQAQQRRIKAAVQTDQRPMSRNPRYNSNSNQRSYRLDAPDQDRPAAPRFRGTSPDPGRRNREEPSPAANQALRQDRRTNEYGSSDPKRYSDRDDRRREGNRDRGDRGDRRRTTYLKPDEYRKIFHREPSNQLVQAYVTETEHGLKIEECEDTSCASPDDVDSHDSPSTEISDYDDASSKEEGDR